MEWLVVNYSECICRQRVPSEQDYQNYIQDVNLNVNVAQLKSNFAAQVSKSAQLIQEYVVKYESEMKAKYQNNIDFDDDDGYGPNLSISSDPSVRDLKFVEEWGVTDLYLSGCPNARNFPRNLKCLRHYNVNLKSVKFAERLTNLQWMRLYIGNEIVNVNGLRALTNLKYLDMDGQRMNDLSAIDYLKAKGCFGEVLCLNSLQKPSQQEIDEARLW
ncbi:Leucine-rich_repeat domain superfamily [Hexamita inflata]|uniref:Leucine-rich repeat domain superfamily n=1 Tax=Hexamita inflata TaxID=28002 RepID=A0AA86NXV0_9EUKA|nr:Leucine-rich repeat domain superfamily [Hexamita inflata]